MSAIASFYLIDVSKLDELKQHAEIIVKKTLFSKKITDNYQEYLSNNAATPLKEFDPSGHLLANLLFFWEEEKNIDLLKNEYDSIAAELTEKRNTSHFIFTHNQKINFIQQLDPANYTLKELQDFNTDFSEDAEEETARYTLDGIRIFRDNLNEIQNDKQVMLLIVG